MSDDDVYVFAHSGQGNSNMFLIEAESEEEARETLTTQLGFEPVGRMRGTVDEIVELHEPDAVQIV